MTDDELIALLPTGHGWDRNSFGAAWAGAARGIEIGVQRERERIEDIERRRREREAEVTA